MRWLSENWERTLFAIVGVALGVFGFYYLVLGDVTTSASAFGFSFFSFFYSNLSRFKRFKGLGFEAELWEEKQKEAAKLVQQLKSIVEIYSSEILKEKASTGRWGGSVGRRWANVWELYNRVLRVHSDLGQEIDFSETKKFLDDYFLFDIVIDDVNEISMVFSRTEQEAKKLISDEFGSPIKDSKGYSSRLQQLRDVSVERFETFNLVRDRILSDEIFSKMEEFKNGMRELFGIDVEYPDQVVLSLKEFRTIEKAGSVSVSEMLIQKADKHG
ncbi:MAG: hypothetical protein JJ913_02835 [Rhizobiaceae bacterium]|nr:hypothetical protein [Rhizobiaceae bacterium]